MTPLVLVHGFMGGSAQWSDLIEALAARDDDVIAVDLPGFGKNAELDPIDSIEAFAVWVIQHLSDLGVERYDLLGHSMGGMIVQEIARRDAAREAMRLAQVLGAAEGEIANAALLLDDPSGELGGGRVFAELLRRRDDRHVELAE